MVGFRWYVLQNSVRLTRLLCGYATLASKFILGMIDAFFITTCIFMGLA